MKFSELKNSLKENIENVYLVEGEDAYFRERALNMLLKVIPSDLLDFNINYFYENYKISEVCDSCLCLPFISQKRIVVVFDYYPKSSEYEKSALAKYVLDPNISTILIIINSKKSELFSKKNITYIDCGKEELAVLFKWVPAMFKAENAEIDSDAVRLLIEYCLCDMSRINTEIKKLAAYCNGEKIDAGTVKQLVSVDTDFQVYELTDAIAKKNGTLALEILESLLEKNDISYISLVLMTLYSAYKRMYLIKSSNYKDIEIANIFKIKEYAVKMLRRQSLSFSAEYLQSSLKLIAKADENFKSGKMNINMAIKFVVFNLLEGEQNGKDVG